MVFHKAGEIKINPETIKGLFDRTKTEIKEDLKDFNQPLNPTTAGYNLEEFALSDADYEDENQIVDEVLLTVFKNPKSFTPVNKKGIKLFILLNTT